MRFIFGFNEVLACINFYLVNKNVETFNLRQGVVMRAWSDLFVNDQELERLKIEKFLDSPTSNYHPFKK